MLHANKYRGEKERSRDQWREAGMESCMGATVINGS